MYDYKEKKNLFLPPKMLADLKQDAIRFEAFGLDEDHLVMNRFISHLLIGYSANYRDKRKKLANDIRKQLQDYISDQYELNKKVAQLLDSFSSEARSYEEKEKEKKKKKEKISYKPTNVTNDILYDIEHSSDDAALSLPHYLRNLFASYLSLPIYEREQIIFKETFDKLKNACKEHQPLILSSASDTSHIYHVVPYDLIHSSDEMFNYLVCQAHREKINPDKDDKPESDKAYTFRMCRIIKFREDPNPNLLKPEIERLLKLMIIRTPQHAIDEDFITRVLLTKDGMKAYDRIFYGRPRPIKPPEILPDGNTILTFNHSFSQLYFYFRRFAANEAVVQEPQRLADEIKAFHADAWKAYELGKPIEKSKNS